MKAFWASIVLFTLLITAVAVNADYIHRITNNLVVFAEELEAADGRSERLDQLENRWNRSRTWIALSVKQSDLNKIDELIVTLRWAHDTQNEEAFLKYRALLMQTAKEFNRTERLSLQNIF